METSHRLAEADARVAGAQAAVRAREAADLPTVTLSGGYTRTNHVEEFGVLQPSGTLRVIYPDIPDNFSSRVAMQWPIYTGGRSDALERAAEAEARAATADVRAARADLRLEVIRAYWALATAFEAERVVTEAVVRADAHLRDVRSRFDSGLVPPNEVATAESLRSRQQMQQIEARNLRRSVMEDLKRLTGLTGDIEPADPLESPGMGGPIPPFAISDAGQTPPSSAATAAPAAGNPAPERAERQALVDRIVAAEDRQKAVAAGRRPALAVTAAVDYANPNPRIFPRADAWRESWEVGVAATWMLWDGGRVAAETAEAAAAADAARARLADLDSLIALEVRQRSLDLESAQAALVAATDGVRSANEARRVVQERFNVGVATSTEVLDAQVDLLQADLDRARALASIRLAAARLDRALGR
jgi:outer membrane protein TolC